MQDYLGNQINVGDYVFGGSGYCLYKVTAVDELAKMQVVELGRTVEYSVAPRQYVRISEEDLTLYFLSKGYKT
jgi:hypothetical protein